MTRNFHNVETVIKTYQTEGGGESTYPVEVSERRLEVKGEVIEITDLTYLHGRRVHRVRVHPMNDNGTYDCSVDLKK